MNLVKKWGAKIAGISTAAGALFTATTTHAAYSTTTIASSFSTSLSDMVDTVVGVVISFFTTNAPTIVALGLAIGLVWYFVGKAKGASRGR